MKMKRIYIIIIALFWSFSAFAQLAKLQRVEPSFWWAGMRNPKLQLLVYGKDIANNAVTINYHNSYNFQMVPLKRRYQIKIDFGIAYRKPWAQKCNLSPNCVLQAIQYLRLR